MKFSASELVKRSASQLLFKELKSLYWQKSAKVSPRQIKGNEFADEIVFKEEAAAEKRGVLAIDDDLIFFCVDMVKDKSFIEIKMVDNEDEYEDWYLKSSIMQSAFYATLLTQVKTLDTPKFKKKEGYKQEVIAIPSDFDFQLWFGKQKFKVYPNVKILNHYLKKIELINNSIPTKDYDSCRIFDLKYKHKEFDIFKPKYVKI